MNIANLAVQIHKLSDNSLWEGVEIAHDMGVSAMTFFGMPRPYTPGEPTVAFLWDELDRPTRNAVERLRSKFDGAVIHAPFVQTPLVSPNPHIERESRRQLLMSVRAAGALGLEAVTVHAGLPTGMTQEEFDPRLVEFLQILGEEAERAGTKIGLENWRYPATPEDHIRLLEAVDHPAVGATLDVGHICYWFENEGITALTDETAVANYQARLHTLIDQIGPHIVHVHLHDVHPNPLRDHRQVGTGMIDFAPVVQQLVKYGFDGVMLFELGEADQRQAQAESVRLLVEAMRHVNEPTG